MTAEAGTTVVTKAQRTRAAILAAAREQFGLHGYDRTSIRAIATQAQIDPAMVMRYFTSKEGLFAAAVDVDLMLPDLRGTPREELGMRLTQHFLDRWEGSLSDDVLVILLRSAVTDPRVAERLRSVFIEQVAAVLRPLGTAGRRGPSGSPRGQSVAGDRPHPLPVAVSGDRGAASRRRAGGRRTVRPAVPPWRPPLSVPSAGPARTLDIGSHGGLHATPGTTAWEPVARATAGQVTARARRATIDG